MSSRERILAALAREPVDYVPCCATFNPLDAASRRDHAWQFPWREDDWSSQLAYQVEVLGLDQVVPFYSGLRGIRADVPVRTWTADGILHKSYETTQGQLHAAVRVNAHWPHGEDIPLHSDFLVAHCEEPWIENARDLACLAEIYQLLDGDEDLQRLQAGAAAARALAAQFDLATIACVGEGLTWGLQIFGAEELCLKVVDDPGLVDDFLAFEHDMNLRELELLTGLGIDIARRNGFYETADFYGPNVLERFLGARLRAEAAMARQAGMHASYTVHTGVMPIMDYLAGLEMDSLFGIDIAFADMDLEAMHNRLGAEVGFWIGPSSTYHLWSGPEATREAVARVFDVFNGSSFVLTPCVSAHSIMPWASTLAMLDEWMTRRDRH